MKSVILAVLMLSIAAIMGGQADRNLNESLRLQQRLRQGGAMIPAGVPDASQLEMRIKQLEETVRALEKRLQVLEEKTALKVRPATKA